MTAIQDSDQFDKAEPRNNPQLSEAFMPGGVDSGVREPIFHYTSPEGLLGIVKDKGLVLRFTRYDCVNDLSEGKDVMRCFDMALAASQDAGVVSPAFCGAVNPIELGISPVMSFNIDNGSLFECGDDAAARSYKPVKCEAYICCFSKDGDSLPMWNYYAKKGVYQGYNIGIIPDLSTQMNIKLGNEAILMEMVSVIYDEPEKVSDIRRVIERAYMASEKGFSADYCRDIIRDELKKRMFRYKSQFFTHEGEIRFILYVPVDAPETTGLNRLKIRYMSQSGYLIPYVDIIYHKQFLRRITVGPLMEKEISIRTLETLKSNYRYSFDIVTSAVPIRY